MARAVITGAEPQLLVTDLTAACDFLTGKLGFEIGFLHGAPPFYGQVRRDGARVNLRHVDRPVIDAAMRTRKSLLSASFTVATAADIERLFDEFQRAGVAFHQPLKTELWGAKDFIVEDPDGNLLLFASPA